MKFIKGIKFGQVTRFFSLLVCKLFTIKNKTMCYAKLSSHSRETSLIVLSRILVLALRDEVDLKTTKS